MSVYKYLMREKDDLGEKIYICIKNFEFMGLIELVFFEGKNMNWN